jgi:hypothetical protein
MMGRKLKLQGSVGVIAIFLVYGLFLPMASAGDASGNGWKVKPGDTLYAIGRAIFPDDVRKQARLRQDIMKLNPSVFAHGANNMKVGVVLKLPPYVTLESVLPGKTPSKAGAPAPTPKPAKVTSKPALPSVSTVKFGGTVWKVRSGDTLYGVCRTIYPEDASKQAQLGRDIKMLNSSVFANGVNNMKAGVVLKLPSYVKLESVAPESVPSKVSEPEPEPVPEKVAPEPVQQPVVPAPVAKTQPETPTVKEQPPSPSSRAEGNAVVSLGFSYGGDKLADVKNGPDIHAGNGAQVRLGYEQMFQNAGGYRASLGLQVYRLLSGGASYRDTYFQLAYQYRASPVLFGIGAVYDFGSNLRSNNNYTFKPAIGGTMYFEFVGSGIFDGLGLGATSLGVKEKKSGTSFNASRAELYYRLRF